MIKLILFNIIFKNEKDLSPSTVPLTILYD